MPVQKSQGGLANLFAKRKGQDISVEVISGGGGNVPAGIEGGTCTLTRLAFDKYKKGVNMGKDYFIMSGVVTSPEVFEGQHIAGMQLNIMEPLYDTPTRKRKTTDEHADWVRGVIRELGFDPDEFNLFTAITDGTIQALLIEAGCQFRFRSWKGEPATEGPYKGKEPMINYDFRGAATPASSNGSASSYVQDDTSGAVEAEEDEPEADEPEDAGDELDALAAAAPKDPKVQAKLHKLAMDAGVDESDFESADWSDVPDLIRTARGDSSGSAHDVAPTIGEVWNYKAKGQKTATEHEIVAANGDDVLAMGEKGDEDDEESQNLLREFGEAFEVDEPDTWTEWAEAIVAEMADDSCICRNCDTNMIVVNVPYSALSAS